MFELPTRYTTCPPERTHARQAVLIPPGVNATRPGPGCRPAEKQRSRETAKQAQRSSDQEGTTPAVALTGADAHPPITKGLRNAHGRPDPPTPHRPPHDGDQRAQRARPGPQRSRHHSRAQRRRRTLHRDMRTGDRRSSHGDPTGTTMSGLRGRTTRPHDPPDPTPAPSPTRCGRTPAAPAPQLRPPEAHSRRAGARLRRSGETVTRWYVASLADGQTHLADRADGALVTARCDGRQFRPLVALPGIPPDQEQICPACRSDQDPTTDRRSG